MLILDLKGISFHAVVVFGLGKDLLFKSVLGRYVLFYPTTFCEQEVFFGWIYVTRNILSTKNMPTFTVDAVLGTVGDKYITRGKDS